MEKAIYFDMDGTIYNFYSVNGWLEMLQEEKIEPYIIGEPLYNMDALNEVLQKAIVNGFTIGVITWTAKGGSAAYNKKVRKVKKEWIQKYLPSATEFHCVKYGTPKHKVAKVKNSVLVDDNEEVRQAWKNGTTIDATKNIIESLEYYLTTIAA